MRKFLVAFISLFFLTTAVANAAVSTFDDLTLGAESYWNGSDNFPPSWTGVFTSAGAEFCAHYDEDFGSGYWDGFSYSNITDTTTEGMAGQYNAIAGGGAGRSSNYAVGYIGFYGRVPTVTLPAAQVVNGAYFTNNNWAYYSMLNGDQFAKKFGGATGDDPDWFLLTITGKDGDGNSTGTVEFYLADYRSSDNSGDYIVDEWTWVDLRSLGSVKTLEFALTSSDTGQWGMNTPAYFAMDSLSYGPTDDSGGCFIGTSGSGSLR